MKVNDHISASSPSAAKLALAIDWPSSLCQACEALSRAPVGAIDAVSVTGRLAGVPGERQALAALARRCAAEYGLERLVSLDDRGITVRFSRCAHGNGRAGRR